MTVLMSGAITIAMGMVLMLLPCRLLRIVMTPTRHPRRFCFLASCSHTSPCLPAHLRLSCLIISLINIFHGLCARIIIVILIRAILLVGRIIQAQQEDQEGHGNEDF